MSKSSPVIFKRSLIALAVLSVSACSSMSLLGLGSENVEAQQQDQYLPAKQISSASKNGKELLPEALVPKLRLSDTLLVADIQATSNVAAELTTKPTKDLIRRNSRGQGSQNIPGDEISSQSTKNTMHEVASGENLWQIAKKTTGNPNNWRVLADINNLQSDGAVFSGQELLIPSRLTRPAVPDISNQGNARASNEDEAFDVTSGETLWQFTKRTTGNATNWKTIAIYNNFSDKQAATVYPGQTIFVPHSLISADYQATVNTKPSTDTEAVRATASQRGYRAMPGPVVVATMGK